MVMVASGRIDALRDPHTILIDEVDRVLQPGNGRTQDLLAIINSGYRVGAITVVAWLEIIMAATDLIAWAKLIGFTDHPDLARCEIATFRYRVLHVAARVTRNARQTRLRIDATWRWAQAIAAAWTQIRVAFT
jgi:hypothetical protein